METLFAWAHLADIHFGDAAARGVRDADLLRRSLVADARRMAAKTAGPPRPDAILLSGDVAFDGRDYTSAGAFVDELSSAFGLSRADVFAVPGNHDIDLLSDHVSKGGLRLVKSLRDGGENIDAALADAEDRALLRRRFQGFLGFANGIAPAVGSRTPAELFWVASRPLRQGRVRIVGVNTALLWLGQEDGKLRVGLEQIKGVAGEAGELVIVLSHHPITPTFIADANQAVAALAQHAHVHAVGRAYLGESPQAIYGKGGRSPATVVAAGGGTEGEGYVYNLCSIVADAGEGLRLRVWPRRWIDKIGDFRSDVASVPDGQPFAEHLLPSVLTAAGPTKPSQRIVVPDVIRPAVTGYLREIDIENVRSISLSSWRAEPGPGWHVMLGDNGSGKTTFLRCVALALLGVGEDRRQGNGDATDSAAALRLDLHEWVRAKETHARIRVAADLDIGAERALPSDVTMVFSGRSNGGMSTISESSSVHGRSIFSAGFGPFRRFTGGDAEHERQFRALPRVSRHASLFEESFSFSESLRWLIHLHSKRLEDAAGPDARFLGRLTQFVNEGGALPNRVQLDSITADAVQFTDAAGCAVPVEELSDGYRSFLSLIVELIRQLRAHYGEDGVFSHDGAQVVAGGVVLIDEVDAHLHPTWQQMIGAKLRRLFPNIQFIVTTHSPLVCQAAVDRGSVFKLPRPGTDERPRMLEGVERDRLFYGNILDAFGTEAFGRVTRSEAGEKKVSRLAALNLKELDEGLSPEEREEQAELRNILPSDAAAQ